METEPTVDIVKMTCNFPGCDDPIKCRGLCHKHYQQAIGSTTPGIRTKAASFMTGTPRKPCGGAKAKPRRKSQTPRVDPGKTLSPRSTEDEGLRGELKLEDPRATADEIFLTLGAKRVPIPSKDGNLYVMADLSKVVWVGPCGAIQPASIHAGENKELII